MTDRTDSIRVAKWMPLSILLLALLACAPDFSPKAPQDSLISALSEDQGILLSYVTANWPDMAVCFDDSMGHHLKLTACYDVPQNKGTLVAKQMPPGSYYLARVVHNIEQVDYKKHKDFEIRKGRVTYIGDITLTIVRKHLSNKLKVSVANNYDATVALFAKEYPVLAERCPVDSQLIGDTCCR